MATKAELLEQAREKGLDVNTSTTKSELVSMLDDNSTASEPDNTGETSETVTESDTSAEAPEETPKEEAPEETPKEDSTDLTQDGDNNENGEKTNGTTLDGNTEPVTNETSVPQNGDTEIQTTEDVDNPVTIAADEARDEEQVKFADESNPNQKARDGGAPGEEYDQDGNLRTGGYSYGVAPEDTTGTVPMEENEGIEPPEAGPDSVKVEPYKNEDYMNGQANEVKEWSVEDQKALEDELSAPDDGIRAAVTTSAGNYVRVKFFYNNKPLGTYTSRSFDKANASDFLADLRKRADV